MKSGGETQQHRPRKFRSASEAAVAGIVGGGNRLETGGDHLPHRRAFPDRRSPGDLEHCGDHRLGALQRPSSLPLPHVVQRRDHLSESGTSKRAAWGEIGSQMEGLQIRGEPCGQGPSAIRAGDLECGHVHLVDIGSFFAIHLDIDEVLVHQNRDIGIFERLALHYVAPVTCGVSDRQKDRTIFRPCPGKGLLSPGIPVDRIVGMLQQVGGFLAGETIGEAVRDVGAHDRTHAEDVETRGGRLYAKKGPPAIREAPANVEAARRDQRATTSLRE